MIKQLGSKQCQLVLIHGGPGAIGSLHCLAEQLSVSIGVAEQFQSKYTIEEVLIELYNDIVSLNCKVTLLGHSWGAWLAGLFAKEHPELVHKLILVGCPPLVKEYVSKIEERRYQRFTFDEQQQFKKLLNQLENPNYSHKEESIEQLGKLVEKADNYCLDLELMNSSQADGEMYDAIWKVAAKWRDEGRWLTIFRAIKCPVYLLQGKYDPHPIEGVTEPLLKAHIITKVYEFQKSGHSPFLELYDRKSFCELVIKLSEPLQ